MICHGSAGGLVLNVASGGGSVVVDPGRLQAAIGPFARKLSLVVLCACHSGDGDRIGNRLGSAAQALHRAGVGAVIASLARHHEYPFHAIQGIETPLMVVFFVLAGASLEIGALFDLGAIGIVYILCRSVGKIVGARIGGEISRADPTTKKWLGAALLPQAGVAIGMALVAASQFPEYRQILLSIVIASTVFFELVGPIFTRLAIRRNA